MKTMIRRMLDLNREDHLPTIVVKPNAKGQTGYRAKIKGQGTKWHQGATAEDAVANLKRALGIGAVAQIDRKGV